MSQWNRLLVVAVLSSSVLGAEWTAARSPATPFATPPAGTTAAPPSTQPASTASREILDSALSALASSDFEKAAKLAADYQIALRKGKVRDSDAAMANGLHVEGVAALRLGQFKRGSDLLRKIDKRFRGERSICINFAICNIQEKGLAALAVKELQPFCVANPTDEAAINLLGNAIADLASESKTANVAEFAAAYARIIKPLEDARPGERRWGVEWVAAAEYAKLEGARRRQQTVIDAALRNVEDAKRVWDRAKAALEVAQSSVIQGRAAADHHDWERNPCQICLRAEKEQRIRVAGANLKRAQADFYRAKEVYDRESPRIQNPSWNVPLDAIDPILIP